MISSRSVVITGEVATVTDLKSVIFGVVVTDTVAMTAAVMSHRVGTEKNPADTI